MAPYGGEAGIRKVGNSAHNGSCMYHSDNLRAKHGKVVPEDDPLFDDDMDDDGDEEMAY